jgi:hypothetical protein
MIVESSFAMICQLFGFDSFTVAQIDGGGCTMTARRGPHTHAITVTAEMVRNDPTGTLVIHTALHTLADTLDTMTAN